MDTKRKRISKKNKQAWRKHINIKDVEEFLEAKRTDERLGGSYDKLSDKDLFKIDILPANKKDLSKREKRAFLLYSTPRCFSVLQPLTKVPDPITIGNRVRTKEERKSKIVKDIEEKKQLRGLIKAKEKLAEKSRAAHRAKKEATAYKLGDFKNDLWEIKEEKVETSLNNEWFDKNTVRHNIVGLGKIVKHVPVSLRKRFIPSVEVPHPGMSYNPSYQDHQNLLAEVAEKEMKIIKEEKHLERVTSKMFKKVTPKIEQENWLVEMSEGLIKPGQKEENDPESDGEYKAINPPVKNKKKDERRKRKQKLQRELEDMRKKAKLEKRKITDIYKLKKFNEEIEKRDKKLKIQQAKREKAKQYKLLEPKRLGLNKFEEPNLEFNEGKDISGNLRNVKMEGHLLRDRFTSLQKRNLLQTTVKRLRKRPKVKVYVKPSHKDVKEKRNNKK